MFLFPLLSISRFLSTEMCTRYRVSGEVIDEPKSAVGRSETEALAALCELVLAVDGHGAGIWESCSLQVDTEKHEFLRAKQARE